MSGIEMRDYLNRVGSPLNQPVIEEGILDSIKKWIAGLASPIKARGNQYSKALEQKLRSKYGASVPKQVQSSNKEWPWSKLTYADLYQFASSQEFTDEEIDRALRNPIVANNMKALLRAAPAGGNQPMLPLKASSISTNKTIISTIMDKQTKQYLSKAIALAVIDGLAYIAQSKSDKKQDQPEKPESTDNKPELPATSGNAPAPGSQPSSPSPQQDLAATISAIKQGLAQMKSTGAP